MTCINRIATKCATGLSPVFCAMAPTDPYHTKVGSSTPSGDMQPAFPDKVRRPADVDPNPGYTDISDPCANNRIPRRAGGVLIVVCRTI
jgi:hypothetical protein